MPQAAKPRTSRLASWFHVEPAWADFCAAAGADTVTAFVALAQQRGQQVASGHHVNVWRTPLESAGRREVLYIKRYIYEDRPARYWGRGSRALVEFRNYSVFQTLGIPGPEAVAVAEVRSSRGLHQALIVTREIPDCRNLAAVVGTEEFRTRPKLRRHLLAQAARLAGTAHRHAFYHRDLKLRNVLVQNFSAADCGIHWIDCPKGGFRRLNRRHFAAADLGDMARLLRPAVSAAEWQEFLAAYEAEAKRQVSP